MPRTHAGLPLKPEKSRSRIRKLLLPGLAACSLLSLFALPHVAAQVSKKASAFAPPGTLPVIGIGDGPGTIATPLPAGLHLTTERYNNARNGVNNQEMTLTPANIAVPQGTTSTKLFTKIFTHTVDGLIYAQPLYVGNLPVTNSIGVTTTRNVVIVATNNNSVYAFDADDTSTGTGSPSGGSVGGPLWRANFNSQGLNATATDANDVTTAFGLPQSDIQPLIGIVGTPVIDETTGMLYVVARTTENNSFVHRLHAVDIRTGLEKINSPALVGQYQDPNTGIVTPISVPGTGDDHIVRSLRNPQTKLNENFDYVSFDLLNQNQRPALTLVNGVVYVSYGSFDGSPPYHGWVFGFQTGNLLASPSIFCTSPNAEAGSGFFALPNEGGIDMSGVGPASDGSALYFATGGGVFNPNQTVNGTTFSPSTVTDYGESILKLGLTPPANQSLLPVQDFFTPYNNDILTQFADIGTGGLTLLPNNALPVPALVTAGQEGKIYLLNRSTLGGLQNSDSDFVISTLPNAADPTIPLLGANFGAPTVFTDNLGQVKVFFHASGDAVRCFNVTNTYPYLTFFAYGSAPSANPTPPQLNYGFPGAQTTVSSKPDGSDGILWDVESAPVASRTGGGITTQEHYAILHAYDVATLTEIYNSTMKGGGMDSIGDYVKFTQPTVAGGKVFVTSAAPTQFDPGGSTTFPQGRLVVFGLTNTTTGSPVPGQGTHYQLSGPVGWAATSSNAPGIGVGPLGFIGTLEVNRSYSFSLTALDANNQPKPITGSVTLSLTDPLGRKTSLGSVSFKDPVTGGPRSYITFSKTVTAQGLYIMRATDSSGNSSQYFPNFGDIPYVQVVGTANIGFDRFNLRMPATARNGRLTNITVTPVTYNGFPIFTRTNVTIYDTLPGGGQDYALPFDADPTDGFGFPNTPPYEPDLPNPPHPTPHSQAPLSTMNFAYELQYGIADYALTPGLPIGIFDDGGISGTSYPNINGSGTYPCVFNGVGDHVVIVYDSFYGQMTTGIITVTP